MSEAQRHLLLVEDDPTLGLILHDLLRMEGHAR